MARIYASINPLGHVLVSYPSNPLDAEVYTHYQDAAHAEETLKLMGYQVLDRTSVTTLVKDVTPPSVPQLLHLGKVWSY
jgi:hypothetical protein